MRMILAVCFVAACATTEYQGVAGTSAQKEICPTGCSDEVARILARGTFEQIAGSAFVTVGELEAGDACSLLPADGLCPLACDADALAAAVPAGTCTDFTCALSDGRTVVAGGCNER